ncbi:MAG: DUF4337 family protein [Verrucomicrobiota bacterium]|jgi:hypothetical protein
MKVQIPDQLKAEVPPTKWGKLLSATPVVMAVVATMLAGLASSEMTRAQYDRALAAQQQSKAGDQWSFFQAKRLRGAIQRNALDLLQSTVELHPLNAAALKDTAEQLAAKVNDAEAVKVKTELLAVLDSPAGQQALSFLQRGEVPPAGAAPAVDPNVKAALDAVENLAPDPEVAAVLARITNEALEDALRAARDHAQAFDTATKPVNQAIDSLDNLLGRLAACLQAKPASDGASSAAGASVTRDFTAARLRYAALRYEVEARLNQAIATFYELQVRKSNISAERHHNRSQRFFFGMLAAQLGVIVSTLAMAARQRNLLWSIAAAAGLVAIAFAVYVYLYV